jgi:hypothetical protein
LWELHGSEEPLWARCWTATHGCWMCRWVAREDRGREGQVVRCDGEAALGLGKLGFEGVEAGT